MNRHSVLHSEIAPALGMALEADEWAIGCLLGCRPMASMVGYR